MSGDPRGGQWLLEASLCLPEGTRGLWVPTHSPQNRSASVQVGGQETTPLAWEQGQIWGSSQNQGRARGCLLLEPK